MKEKYILFGMSFMLSLSIIMAMIFVNAYLSPDKSVHVFIDKYSEAGIELVLMAFMLPTSLFTTLLVLDDYSKRRKSIGN